MSLTLLTTATWFSFFGRPRVRCTDDELLSTSSSTTTVCPKDGRFRGEGRRPPLKLISSSPSLSLINPQQSSTLSISSNSINTSSGRKYLECSQQDNHQPLHIISQIELR